MAPLLQNQSPNIGTISTASLLANNPGVAQPATRKPVAFSIDPQELIKPVIPNIIKTPQQLVNRSSEVPVQTKTVAPLQSGQQSMPEGMPLIAGNVSKDSLQPKANRKYMTKDQVRNIMLNAPEGVDKSTLLDDIVANGYILEGYNDAQSQFTGQAPVRVKSQFKMGEKPTTPLKGGVRRGSSGLSTDMGDREWLNPVGKLTQIISEASQKIPTFNTEEWAQNRIDKKISSLSKQELDDYKRRFNNSKTAQKLYGSVDNFIREKEASLLESLAGGGVENVGGPSVPSMIANIPGSLTKTATATAQGVTNPVDTIEGLTRLVATEEGRQVLKDRYGTIDNFARSMNEDPVGVASDILTVVQGGAGLASKGAKLAGLEGIASKSFNLPKVGNYGGQNLGTLSDISKAAGGAADLGLGVGINKLNTGIGNIASKPLRIAAKTALAPTQPLTAGKEVLGGVVSKERADKMLSNMNRITKPQQEKFAEMAGETVGEFLNNRGIVEGGDKAISKIANKFVESIDKADQGLEAIKGEYKDEFLSLMGKESAEFAENTLSPDAKRMRELSNKADTRGLTMTESNELKRFYQRNNKFTYGKDITAGEKTIRATNIDNAVRKRQFDIAEQNGFSNLKQINKETQAFKYLLDKLSKNEAGRLGNNAMGLTDWIVAGQVAIDPSSIALLVGKKVAESNWFRSNVVKIINKLSGHKNKGDLTLDLGKIQGIQSEKDLNKYLALPLKENVNSPTLNTMNRSSGNQGAIVGTNAVVSPKPKLPSNIVIEKGVATKPGTTKDIVAKLDQQIRAKKQVTSMPLENQIDRINPRTGEGFDKSGKSLGIVDKNAAKQGETPVKTVPKTTETKIEPKKATVDQELQKVAQKVKEKSLAKKENGSIMDGMKTTIYPVGEYDN